MHTSRRALEFGRTHVAPYAIPILTVALIVIAIFAIAGVLLRPDDAVVIEVVPIDDEEQLQVQIAGAVATPGVYSLQTGSTLEDLLELAGGATNDAQVDSMDISVMLADGQFILIPYQGSTEAVTIDPLDINSATTSEFETLPGIGPVIAERIVQYRESVGGFKSVDELAEVTGISARMVQELRPFVFVEPR